ncbi:uncharacterized protein MONBRDRAFT_10240 [Monosiga brevicollis MX1]|uniref:EGF-like domain-containing protein n=1 Tax=Monosiga brevicollis TaxID=81824 RepID=A9V5M3_MONBE|nr:uncharacterized protein MONBRDRAFT_10240 [Monosiga brevicollis MX1]EDQ87143.1 predicted protein [Monosiga brevicollis MX1]|eukprot:XP_001748086.1 hypothetical protein [Monosiga brevicollis MX1]
MTSYQGFAAISRGRRDQAPCFSHVSLMLLLLVLGFCLTTRRVAATFTAAATVPIALELSASGSPQRTGAGLIDVGCRRNLVDRDLNAVAMRRLGDLTGCTLDTTEVQTQLAGLALFVTDGSCALSIKRAVARQLGASLLVVWRAEETYPAAPSTLAACANCAPTDPFLDPFQTGTSSNIVSADPSPSSYSDLCTLPVLGVEPELGMVVAGYFKENIVPRLTVPDLEPLTCLAPFHPALTSVVFISNSRLRVQLNLSTSPMAARCWYHRKDLTYDPCISTSSELASCLSARVDALLLSDVTVSSPTLECNVPLDILANRDDYTLAVQVLYGRGDLITLQCFSHQHQRLSLWTATHGRSLATIGVNVDNATTTSTCACTSLCHLRIRGKNGLWCQGESTCTSAQPVAIRDTVDLDTTALAIPCAQQLPGLPYRACATSCSGGRCEADGTCTCVSGWQDTNCDEPICSQGCAARYGTCVAPNVCNCSSNYTGPACTIPMCSHNCSGNGVCASPGVCRCFEGYTGSSCATASPSDSTSGSVTMGTRIAFALLVSALVVCLVVVGLLWRIKKARPHLIVQQPPEGVELGPLVTRVRTVRRSFLGLSNTTRTTEDFYENLSQDAANTAAGLLPSYQDATSSSTTPRVTPVPHASPPTAPVPLALNPIAEEGQEAATSSARSTPLASPVPNHVDVLPSYEETLQRQQQVAAGVARELRRYHSAPALPRAMHRNTEDHRGGRGPSSSRVEPNDANGVGHRQASAASPRQSVSSQNSVRTRQAWLSQSAGGAQVARSERQAAAGQVVGALRPLRPPQTLPSPRARGLSEQLLRSSAPMLIEFDDDRTRGASPVSHSPTPSASPVPDRPFLPSAPVPSQARRHRRRVAPITLPTEMPRLTPPTSPFRMPTMGRRASGPVAAPIPGFVRALRPSESSPSERTNSSTE